MILSAFWKDHPGGTVFGLKEVKPEWDNWKTVKIGHSLITVNKSINVYPGPAVYYS